MEAKTNKQVIRIKYGLDFLILEVRGTEDTVDLSELMDGEPAITTVGFSYSETFKILKHLIKTTTNTFISKLQKNRANDSDDVSLKIWYR